MSGSSTTSGPGASRADGTDPTASRAADGVRATATGRAATARDAAAQPSVRDAAYNGSGRDGTDRLDRTDRPDSAERPGRGERPPKMSRKARKAAAAAADSPARRARRIAWERDRRSRREQTMILVSALLGLLFLSVGLIGLGVYHLKKAPAISLPTDATTTADGLAVGGSGPVAVDVYVDYECPGCRAFQSTATATLQELISGHQIRLIYHPEATLDPLTTTQYSTRAAESAACAANLNMFLPYTQALLERQPPPHSAGLSDDELIQVAGDVGIIDPRFAQCVRGHTFNGWIGQVTTLARGHRVTTVPIVLVNGAAIAPAGALPSAEQLKAAVVHAAATPAAGGGG